MRLKRGKQTFDPLDFDQLNLLYTHYVAKQLRRLRWEEARFRRRGLSKREHYLEFAKHYRQEIIAGAAGLFVLLFGVGLYVLVVPQTVEFKFSEKSSCVTSPALFPGLLRDDPKASFRLKRPAAISARHTALISGRLCGVAQTIPRSTTTYNVKQTWGLGPLHVSKTVHVKTASYAKASTANLSAARSQALPILEPVKFTLSSPDSVFGYAIVANGKQADCTKNSTKISCDLAPLELKYGADYQIALARQFEGKAAGTVLTKNIKTITATAITQTSIAANSTVYDLPQQITLQTSKPLRSIKGLSLSYTANNKKTVVPITSSYKDTTITVKFKDVLPRQTLFDLRIENVTAIDDSQLEGPYDLPFTTSGGPKVTSISIGARSVGSQSPITVYFDQQLSSSQPPEQMISLTANSTAQAVSYSVRGNALTITPKAALPVCARFTVSITDAIQSQYGISGGSAWSFNSRVLCYTTFSIGSSVKGRPITAYQFGSGASMVLYIGATHGDEKNSMAILQKWTNALEASPDKIPANRTIVVIPAINPDGVAANTRRNANNIDLNRNFPTADWQTQVTEPDSHGQPTNTGGSAPLSEPESQALANYVQAKRPRLVMTYHSHAGVVEANDAGDSDALGNTYALSAGYRAIPTYAIGNTFDYSTTGAFEDWANQKLGVPAIVVELTSATNDEFSRNQAAMWTMATLP